MADQKLQVKEVIVREKKTLGEILGELGLDHRFHAVLVDSKKVSDLKEVIDPNSKVIVLPRLRGG